MSPWTIGSVIAVVTSGVIAVAILYCGCREIREAEQMSEEWRAQRGNQEGK